jgi:hypothetical protein
MLIFNRKLLNCKRFAAGELDHGRYVKGPETAFTIRASVQAITPAELALLDEGKRTKQNSVIITEDVLSLATQSTKADWIEIAGEWYEVSAKSEWDNGVMPNNRYVVTKIENAQDF